MIINAKVHLDYIILSFIVIQSFWVPIIYILVIDCDREEKSIKAIVNHIDFGYVLLYLL